MNNRDQSNIEKLNFDLTQFKERQLPGSLGGWLVGWWVVAGWWAGGWWAGGLVGLAGWLVGWLVG